MFDLPPPDPGIEIALFSQGMSKGLRQTDGPQIFMRGEVAFGPVYLGAYAKNVSSPTSDGEAGALVGARHRVGGFDLSASAAWKHAIDPEAGLDDQALELSAAIGRRIGAVTPRLSIVWSPDDLGGTGRSTFAEAGAAWRIAPDTNLSAAWGLREREGGADYRAFNAGIGHMIAERFTIDVRYYDTDRSALGEVYEERVVASLRARF